MALLKPTAVHIVSRATTTLEANVAWDVVRNYNFVDVREHTFIFDFSKIYIIFLHNLLASFRLDRMLLIYTIVVIAEWNMLVA